MPKEEQKSGGVGERDGKWGWMGNFECGRWRGRAAIQPPRFKRWWQKKKPQGTGSARQQGPPFLVVIGCACQLTRRVQIASLVRQDHHHHKLLRRHVGAENPWGEERTRFHNWTTSKVKDSSCEQCGKILSQPSRIVCGRPQRLAARCTFVSC